MSKEKNHLQFVKEETFGTMPNKTPSPDTPLAELQLISQNTQTIQGVEHIVIDARFDCPHCSKGVHIQSRLKV